jgi:hypothetical protein
MDAHTVWSLPEKCVQTLPISIGIRADTDAPNAVVQVEIPESNLTKLTAGVIDELAGEAFEEMDASPPLSLEDAATVWAIFLQG